MKLSQENKNNPEPIFKFIDHAHPGINECPFCGIGYGLYEYKNTKTNEKVFSCHSCIRKGNKREHLQKIITFTTAYVNKKIGLEQYIKELENWFQIGFTFLTSQELRALRLEANRLAGLN